jgi:N-acetylmuramate 1-kinase
VRHGNEDDIDLLWPDQRSNDGKHKIAYYVGPIKAFSRSRGFYLLTILDKRFEALKEWTGRVLGAGAFDIRPASADASFRRYFRVTQGSRSLIVMDAPPDKGGMHSYVTIARHFHALGLNVPEVLEQDHERGFLLITDLGDQLYQGSLNEQTVERLYGDALGALVVLQAGTSTTSDKFLPDYDEALLLREMQLARSALAQPRVWVHRDYHSRNLMVTRLNNPGILDFQDAVLGPVTYDLVSLLRDCYISWPRERVEDWVKGYHELALQSGIPVSEDDAGFLCWFDLMGVQRHLKASGIFARLNHRDGKPGYLADIPRTLGYVHEVSARYPELQPLQALLRELKLPGAA